MRNYLYIFCYQTPSQASAAAAGEAQEESSQAVFICATSQEEALAWGLEIAERFVKDLFPDGSKSWKSGKYAHWIEGSPEEEYPSSVLSDIPVVELGIYPSFKPDPH